jgi:DNA-binding response OmpR family regulator
MSEEIFRALRAAAARAATRGLAAEPADELARLVAAAEAAWRSAAGAQPQPAGDPPAAPDSADDFAPAGERPDSGLRLAQLEHKLLAFGRGLQIGRRVLLVDDDMAAQTELLETLAQHQILADVATSADEALERLGEQDYAVLITAARLPDRSGVELIAELMRERPMVETLLWAPNDRLDEALQALERGAADVMPKPPPSRPFISWKVRAALARHAFTARTQAVIQFLSRSCEELAVVSGQDLQASCVLPLKRALASYDQNPGPTRVAVAGPKPMLRVARGLGYEAAHAGDLAALLELVRTGRAQVVLVVDEPDGFDAIEVITRVRRLEPTSGVFAVAPERELQALVQAIGDGVGDTLLRPLEGRELLAPRLRRLIARRETHLRYERLLTELKSLNIDLRKALDQGA